ncbi:MAG TPA: FtsX-like permease family protein [Methylomirabilota bacterium]|nr:FtsX-like permease family protein [Methylomirabilota bacterium]
MRRQLGRIGLRHLGRHPWQVGLAVLGIALGVAVAVSIDLANESARRAFSLATEAVTGRATHQIVAGPSGLPDDFYRVLKVELGARPAAPILSGDVAAADRPGRTFTVLGVDPFAEEPFRPYLGEAGRSSAPGASAGERRDPPPRDRLSTVAALVTRPGAVLVARPTARELGLAVGDRLAIRVAGARRELVVVGLLEPGDPASARALDGLLVTDIASAQEIFGAAGRIGRIDLIASDDEAGRALLERVARRLPPGAELVTAGARAGTTAQMIRAFQWNLTALSLLALVVGMFLIYQTMTFSVVQRRPLIGALRALGVTRGEIFALVMTEAALIGVVGTAAGLALGFTLARGLLGLVTRTINDLYFVLSVRDVTLDPLVLAKGVLLGVGATLAAALAPALEATGAPPRVVMSRGALETSARRMVTRATWIGAGLVAGGALVLALPAGIVGGFAGLFVLMIGSALVAPAAALGLLRLLQPPIAAGFGTVGRLAARGIVAAFSRTSVAIAALMIAVSAAIGVGIMIASFREAVVSWLEGTLRADVYVSAPSLVGNRPDATLDPALVTRLAATRGVARAGTSRSVLVPGPGGPVQVVALDVDPARPPRWRFREGSADVVWSPGRDGAIGDTVIVSEPYANRRAVRPGDAVRLRTDRGDHDFRVGGVFYDYGSSAGVVVMGRRTYDRFWDDRKVSGLAIEAAPGADLGALIADLRARAAGGQEIVVRSNRALREASLEIFDRTFAVTGVLRTLTVAVAFIGMLAALMALQLERAREIAVLRTLGLTPRQVWRLVTVETGLMGLLAGVLAVPGGLLLAGILVFVINRRSFGWTMPIDPSPAILLQGVALSVLAAVLAGLYPAWRMARALPADALRDE